MKEMFKSGLLVMLLTVGFMSAQSHASANETIKMKPGIYVRFALEGTKPHPHSVKSKHLCAIKIKEDLGKDYLDYYFVESPLSPGLCYTDEFGPYPVAVIKTSSTTFIDRRCEGSRNNDYSKCTHYVLYQEL